MWTFRRALLFRGAMASAEACQRVLRRTAVAALLFVGLVVARNTALPYLKGRLRRAALSGRRAGRGGRGHLAARGGRPAAGGHRLVVAGGQRRLAC